MKTMTETPLFALERRERIIQLLTERSKILVPELCDIFCVSAATIRGDLRDLENDGQLRRTHGGAIPLGQAAFEPGTTAKEVERVAEKRRIAALAADFVQDGDTIALDSGTTILEFAKRLTGKRNLTVVTNAIDVASFLEANSDVNLLLVGGAVRRGFRCTTGPVTLAGLAGLNVDTAYMAANAFTVENGFTTPNLDHAEVKKTMLGLAARSVMLMDSSKVGRIAFAGFAGLGDIDKLVTDTGMSATMQMKLREANENVEVFAV